MTDVIDMKQAGKGKIDPKAATRRGDIAKGQALATVCVNYATEEAQAEEKRGAKRMQFVKRIADLSPDGHAAFRSELQKALAFLDESEKAAVSVGALKEAPSRHGGYSLASFRVMVSNWRTISVACETGMKIEAEQSWESTLEEARATRKAQQASGNAAVIEGTRKQGAGRKALTDYDKALRLVAKLNLKDMRKLATAVAGLIEAAETKAPKRAAKEQPATVH